MNKETILIICGYLTGVISAFFGGWNHFLTTLVFFMGVDFVTGLVVAGVFKKSKKTANGALESNIGWKGLVKKGIIMLVVLVAHRLDMVIGSTFIRDSVIIAFILNELISIAENIGLMGIHVPKALTKAIDVLKEKAEK